MTAKDNRQDNLYYITETCYVLPGEFILVNNGKQSKKIADLPWKLLYCFMQRYGMLVRYEDIYVEVWGDPQHKHDDVTRVMHRLRKCFREVGVDDEMLDKVYITTPKKGITFKPYRPVVTDLRRFIDFVSKAGIPEREMIDIVECMLYRGISGRMGREGVIELAKRGNTLAALEVGELYYYGYITRNHKRDYKSACEWYEKAGNHPTALWTLGYCIMNNYYPVVDRDEIDYLKARDYFDRALKISTDSSYSAPAYTSLGQLWEDGHYPEDDFATTRRCKPRNMEYALEYYQKAAELGYHYATNRLGLYHEKRGLPQIGNNTGDRKKAFDYFMRSVELVADGYAFNKLGNYYETGFGCEANPSTACEYYMRGVDEVLEDDITGWNLFNAGRVCANRIASQPERFYNLPRAFDLFSDALRKLPVASHGKVLLEVMEILLFDDTSALSPEVVRQKKLEILYFVNRYLDAISGDANLQRRNETQRLRDLYQNLKTQ